MYFKNNLNHFIDQAIITTGGRGTRLKEVTGSAPKTLWPINGINNLERIIKNLTTYGINKFIFLTYFKSELFVKEAKILMKSYDIQIEVIIEKEPEGEAGSLLSIVDKLNKRFLFINGDIVFQLDLKRLIDFHINYKSDLTFITHTSTHPEDSDAIIETPSRSVFKFKFKNEISNNNDFYLGNAALCIVEKDIILYRKNKPKKIKNYSFFKDFIIFAHNNSFKVLSYNTSEYLKDMGTPKRLREVEIDINNNMLNKKSYENPQKVLFLDRDNTLISCKEGEYIVSSENISYLNERIKKISEISKEYDFTIIITNQPQISRGLITSQECININGNIINVCRTYNLEIACFYYCPHHPDTGFSGELKELKKICFCRKPSPGMFLQAALERNIDLQNSLFIGDSESDYKSAKNLNIKFKYAQSLD